MLRKCTLTCEVRILAPNAALELANATFDANAAALVEGMREARLSLWGSIAPDALTNCLRLVIATEAVELRCERQKPSGDFVCRLARETEGDTHFVRESTLLLRNSAHIAPSLRAEGHGRMCSRDYFTLDDDGMPRFVAERLAGVTTA